MRRAAVVGACGAGKTSFAVRLARALGVRSVKLDALHREAERWLAG